MTRPSRIAKTTSDDMIASVSPVTGADMVLIDDNHWDGLRERED
jgi:hypothetical protein